MTYRSLPKQTFRIGDYEILPIRQQDMAPIKEWRNAQITILRQEKPLSDRDQTNYWSEILAPSFNQEHPKQILFSYLLQGECIGYGGLTHIDWSAKRGEVSFLLDPARTKDAESYRRDFSTFLSLLKEAVFKELRFHRMFTETFSIRPIHVSVLEKFGFIFEGALKDHVKIGDAYCDSLIHGMINHAKLP